MQLAAAAVMPLILALAAASSVFEIAGRSIVCDQRGWSIGANAYFYQRNTLLATPEECGKHCRKEETCLSYAIGKDVCMHFEASVARSCRSDKESPYRFYDKSCMTTSPPPTVPPPVSRQLCKARGYDRNKPKASVYSTSYKTRSGCLALCNKSAGCKSFAVGNGACLLYSSSVAVNFESDRRSHYLFWDLSCSKPQTSLASKPSITTSVALVSSASLTPSAPYISRSASSTSGIIQNSISSKPVGSATSTSYNSFGTFSSVSLSRYVPSVALSSTPTSSVSVAASDTGGGLATDTTFTDGTSSSSVSITSVIQAMSSGFAFTSSPSISSSLEAQPPTSTSLRINDSSSVISSPSSTNLASISQRSSILSSTPTSASTATTASSSQYSLPVTPTTTLAIPPSSTMTTRVSNAAVSLPADFTRTYTYEDYMLPIVTAMGSSPLSAGLHAPTDVPTLPAPCVVDSTQGENAPFKILAPNGLPIVQLQNSAIGPFPSPTSQAAADALGDVSNLALSTYFFRSVASSTAYDLVLVGSPMLYIARLENGDVILTDSSTGPQGATRNGRTVVTSIFNVDCKGRISALDGNGRAYTWTVSGSVTIMTADNSDQRMLTLPSRTSTSHRLRRRQNQSTSGVAPRCPNTPPNLRALTKLGVGASDINGCSANNGYGSVPPAQYNFVSCCNNHDACYDNCEQKTYEGCNMEFQSCMKNQACAALNQLSTYNDYLACTQLADYSYSVVSSDSGRQAFYEQNNRRCGCYCSETQGLCLQSDSSYQCTNLFGTDSQNCGACGRACPAKTRCSNGNCVCAHDQCSDRCVDLQTHPGNCGSCGNVCASGYCFQGSCYTPPPSTTTCTLGEGFANGQFADDFSGWTTSRAVPAPAGVVAIGRGPDASASDGFDLYFDPTSVYQTASTEVRVCSGVSYELTFKLRTENDKFGACNIWVMVASSRRIYQDTTRPASDVMRSVGPYTVGSFTANTPSVRQSGADLFVPFQVVLQCQGQGGGSVRFDAFSLTPYTPS